MIKFVRAAIAAAIAVSPTVGLADFKRVTTEADYRALVAGKTVVTDTSTVTILKNGKLRGTVTSNGAKISGAWAWRDGFWCRSVTVAGNDAGTDCQLVEVDGTRIRGTRDRGRGETFIGQMK
ncbi:hypothetical protein [Thalassococcus sp. S3]|uniref:hypothetical protein n=1 Tax=Thalassococcus sp. S3 TaxID=2017482 RepID=UPI0010240DF0|nr:hypothetical protein [Thalassococcus sp. S3]QBF30421.1 hypothetical protein CFI11_04215 [Thalassococcus sp. S3]